MWLVTKYRNMKKENVLTNGNIKKGLLQFAIPLLLGSALQQLYGMADILFVSRCLGTHASAAVGASSTIVTCLIGLFTGISTGAGLIIANYRGAKNVKEEKKSIRAALCMGIVGGIIVMVVGLLLSRQILVWMKTPKEILSLALLYIRIYFLAIPFMILYNLCSAIFQALGDPKRPVILLAVGGVLNVFLDALLIAWLPFGVVGAGVATLVSQGVSSIVLFVILIKREQLMPLRDSKITVYIPQILKIGLPAGIQAVILTMSNLLVQYYINSTGENAVAAFTIYYKVENFIYMPILAFGQSMLVFTGQNLGAGNRKRAWRGLRECNILSGGVTIVMSMLVVFFATEVMHMFSTDEAVVRLGCHIMRFIYPWYVVYSLMEVTAAFIKGNGKTFSAMIISMVFLCGSRIIFLKLFTYLLEGIDGVAIVYPVTWGLAMVVYVLYALILRRKGSEELQRKEAVL